MNTKPEEEPREVVVGAVPDTATAETVVARLARLIDAGSVRIIIETIEDDPATPVVESGLALVAEVPASCAEAARATLEAGKAGEGRDGEGGI